MVDVSFYPQVQPNALLGTAGSVVGLNQGALAARQAHQDLVKGQVDYLANGLGALASKSDLTTDDLVGFGQRAVDEGILDPNTFNVEMQQVRAANNDPQSLRALATQFQLRALDAGQKFNAQFGTPGTIDTGNMIQPVTSSSLTGIHPLGAPIQKTLSPSELAQPTTVLRNGVPTLGTQGQALEAAGVNPLTAMPNQAGNALTGPQPQQPAFAPLPVGESEAAQKVGGASGEQLANDRTLASNFQTTVLPLQQAIQHINELGPNATGPGAEDINTIQSFLQTMGLPVVDPNKVANFDELKKYLVQIGRSNGNSGTNDQLAAALAGSPGTTVSTLANKDILKTLLGMARLRNAQVLSFDQQGLPQSQYGQYASQFNNSADPRAYVFDMLDPSQRADLVKSLAPSQKTKFVQSLRNAVQLGLVTPPNG